MITRSLHAGLLEALGQFPAVALLGARQAGKTTLALEIAKGIDAIYLDLESVEDLAKMGQPELYLSAHQDKLVILDEVHRLPGLFPILRGLIDRARREGRQNGQYLLLGSASLDLLKQSGETLAGRIAYLELTPFTVSETGPQLFDDLWVRGGFPESLLAGNTVASLRWRQNFIRTYLERDIPQFGPRIAAETLRRFWTMQAWHQGGLMNMSRFARNLGVDVKTIGSYIDLLVDLLLVRRLPSWHGNISKRLAKSPKVYVRDSGIVHALLSIPDWETLLSHPVVGQSWECFVAENILVSAPDEVQGFYYRTGGGAEVDLLLSWPDDVLWAIKMKRSLAPKLEKGFHAACADLNPSRKFVVYPGTERYPLAPDIEAISLGEMTAMVAGSAER